MFEELLSKPGIDLSFDQVVTATEGYSGSDIRILCKEAAMRPLRRLMGLLDKMDHPSSPEGLCWSCRGSAHRTFVCMLDTDD